MSDFVLSTPRLLLRPHCRDDVDFTLRLNSDPDVIRYTGEQALENLDQAKEIVASLMREWEERRLGRLVVIERKSAQAIGWCGLKWYAAQNGVDLGYRFFPSAWGQGFATEAAAACLEEAERRGLYVYAGAYPNNAASVRVLEKLGLSVVGTYPDDDDGLLFERASEPSASHPASQD